MDGRFRKIPAFCFVSVRYFARQTQFRVFNREARYLPLSIVFLQEDSVMKESKSSRRPPDTSDRNGLTESLRRFRGTTNRFFSHRVSSSCEVDCDRPIPKPTTDLGFRGISHKRTHNSFTTGHTHRSHLRSKSAQSN